MRLHSSQRRIVVALTFPVVLAGAALTGCSADAGDRNAAGERGCITDFEAGVDYFPHKSELVDAQGFSIDYHDSYQVLTVAEEFQGGGPASYVLVRCGAPEPDLEGDLAKAPVITTPVSSLYSGSTTHLPSLVALDVLAALTGVSNAGYVSTAEVIERIDKGAVVEYASGGPIDVESVVRENPDVLITGGTDDPAYAKLRKAGIPVVADTEWLEKTALGRAEWIKFFAALTGTEEQAAEEYAEIKADYEAVEESLAEAPDVEVLLGSMYEGTWHMAPGGGYLGQMIESAGGTYGWIDSPQTGSLPLDFESVYHAEADAEVWIINDSTVNAATDLVARDPRYGQFETDRLWNATKSLGPGGGNNYWELGVLRPDLVLADLAAILHPELMPDHEFTFHHQMPQR